jgi:hypothetical protein
VYRAFALGLAIAICVNVFLAQFLIRLMFHYFAGEAINIQATVVVLAAALVGLSIVIAMPIYITLQNDNLLSIYMLLGLKRLNYDLRSDIESIVWVKNGAILRIKAKDGKAYRLSRHSFIGLRKIFKESVLQSSIQGRPQI